MEEIHFGTGAVESQYDVRTVKHDVSFAGEPLIKGGYKYSPEEIEHQHKVGICTAISLIQNANKFFGKKFSADFQYLLQKKYFDKNWSEGSSIFSAMKIGKNYGFLEERLFTFITEADRSLPYNEYIEKLKSIPDYEIEKLLKLITHKLSGYAEVDVSDPQAIAKAINDSKAGIVARFLAGNSWYMSKDGRITWKTKDIDPIRYPEYGFSGHAIITSSFDFSNGMVFELANTWGIEWNDENKGNAHTNWNDYKMTEAYIPYFDFVPEVKKYTHNFTQDLDIRDSGDEVTELQKALSVLSYFKLTPTGYYGKVTAEAVLKFQIDNVKLSWYERYILRGSRVGAKTRNVLNVLFNQ